MPTPRIVSLVPSATEAVFRLGLGDALVGRSHVCDWPREAQRCPALTRPRFEETSSRGIHDELRANLEAGLAIYDIDLETLRRLAPTHLLVQDQCSVCAVSPSDLEAALSEWLGQEPILVRVSPHDLADVWGDLQRIGDALGAREQARQLRLELSDRLTALVERIDVPERRPKVACVEWLDPLMIAGHWVPELVHLAGGDPVLAKTGGASTTIDLDELIQAEPDLIFVECCGFDLEASKVQWQAQDALRGALRDWVDARTRAAAKDRTIRLPRIVLTDGDAFFNRPGPRLVESAEILAEALSDGIGHDHRHGSEARTAPAPRPGSGSEPDATPHFGRDWIFAPGFEESSAHAAYGASETSRAPD